MSPNDSNHDTLAHVLLVQQNVAAFVADLVMRGARHDQSKFSPQEKPLRDRYVPELRRVPYGSPEYDRILAAMKPAIDHHHRVNRHHPEHFANGVSGMHLLDLVEMWCDWEAAGQRAPGGQVNIELALKRYGIDGQLADVLRNTAAVWREIRSESFKLGARPTCQ